MKHRLLSLLLCAVLILGMLSGCTKDSPIGTTGNNGFGAVPEETAEAGSTMSEVVSTGIFSMPVNASYGWDPFSCASMENRAVMQLIYEGLFTMNQTFDPEPVLCRDYTVSESGLQYDLTLRDAKFSDGRTITAEDVVYSYQKATESDIYGARFRDVNYMVATGLNTLTIYMINPNDRLPCMLDFPIVPNFSSIYSPIGTGPFVRDGTSQLVKNQHWWQGAHNIAFDTIGLYASKSAEDTRDHFEIDTIQFIYNDPLDSSAATYHCDYELWNSKGTIMQYLCFNMQEGVFQDSRLRSAVLKAIDRSEIAESVYHNYADASALPVSPASSMYEEDLARLYEYDRDAALDQLMNSGSFYLPDDHPVVTGAIFDEDYDPNASPESEDSLLEEELLEEELLEEDFLDEEYLLDEELEEETDEDNADGEDEESDNGAAAGYNPITMLVMSGSLYRSEAAEKVAEYLENVGFTVTIREMGHDEMIYTVNNLKEEWDLFYVDAYLTPDFDLRSILYPGNKFNYNNIPEDSELRSIYYKALENSGNRYDLYEYLMEKAYICPILFQNNAVFTTRGVFKGLNPTPDSLFYGITNITINN